MHEHEDGRHQIDLLIDVTTSGRRERTCASGGAIRAVRGAPTVRSEVAGGDDDDGDEYESETERSRF